MLSKDGLILPALIKEPSYESIFDRSPGKAFVLDHHSALSPHSYSLAGHVLSLRRQANGLVQCFQHCLLYRDDLCNPSGMVPLFLWTPPT